jgi:hypothetical protein
VQRLALLALAATALLAGCGGDEPPDTLNREDSRALLAARERLDEAIDTEEAIRTSKTEARRLVKVVRRIAEGGGLERGGGGDDFSQAALEQVQEAAPSLVRVDSKGRPTALDTEATETFLAYAETDAARALLRPARRAVGSLARVAEDSDAGPETKVQGAGGKTVGGLLEESEADVKPIWPALARRLDDARGNLD